MELTEESLMFSQGKFIELTISLLDRSSNRKPIDSDEIDIEDNGLTVKNQDIHFMNIKTN
jgi:hypothetical protein